MTKPVPSPYGQLLRQRRVEAGLSLRDVAGELDVSHTFVADIERGVRGPLKPEHESILHTIMPRLSVAELARARALTRPVKITLADTPEQYQEVAIALARRIEDRNLTEEKLARILKLLNDDTLTE